MPSIFHKHDAIIFFGGVVKWNISHCKNEGSHRNPEVSISHLAISDYFLVDKMVSG